MWTDNSPSCSSENATPPLLGSTASEKDVETDSDSPMKTSRPHTPPRQSASNIDGLGEPSPLYHPHLRRLSCPPKIPRILNLVSESRTEDTEAKSEAQFQRLVASFSELPTNPRTPRAPSDRGRYPEEAGDDSRENTPSDDGDDDDFHSPFSYAPPTSEPININSRARTSAPSISGSVNGDDSAVDSPGGAGAMDIDLPSSSTFGSPAGMASSSNYNWRYTPPPTASAVRTNKRKHDDRYDPYPNTSKRRAVSPSVTYLRDSHSSLSPIFIPRSTSSSSRTTPLSMPIPIPIPNNNYASGSASVNSSPTYSSYLSGSYPGGMSRGMGPGSVASSPTMRSSMSLTSPIARTIRLGRKVDGDAKDVDSAEDSVNSLKLG